MWLHPGALGCVPPCLCRWESKIKSIQSCTTHSDSYCLLLILKREYLKLGRDVSIHETFSLGAESGVKLGSHWLDFMAERVTDTVSKGPRLQQSFDCNVSERTILL